MVLDSCKDSATPPTITVTLTPPTITDYSHSCIHGALVRKGTRTPRFDLLADRPYTKTSIIRPKEVLTRPKRPVTHVLI